MRKILLVLLAFTAFNSSAFEIKRERINTKVHFYSLSGKEKLQVMLNSSPVVDTVSEVESLLSANCTYKKGSSNFLILRGKYPRRMTFNCKAQQDFKLKLKMAIKNYTIIVAGYSINVQ